MLKHKPDALSILLGFFLEEGERHDNGESEETNKIIKTKRTEKRKEWSMIKWNGVIPRIILHLYKAASITENPSRAACSYFSGINDHRMI